MRPLNCERVWNERFLKSTAVEGISQLTLCCILSFWSSWTFASLQKLVWSFRSFRGSKALEGATLTKTAPNNSRPDLPTGHLANDLHKLKTPSSSSEGTTNKAHLTSNNVIQNKDYRYTNSEGQLHKRKELNLSLAVKGQWLECNFHKFGRRKISISSGPN